MNFSCWYINVYQCIYISYGTENMRWRGSNAIFFSILYVLTTQRLYRITADPLPAVGTID